MLLVDALIYLLLALYIEAIAPGEYGVPKPWYFPLQVCMNMYSSELKLSNILHAGLYDIVRWQQMLPQFNQSDKIFPGHGYPQEKYHLHILL
jgi:hypothetical protein